MWVGVMCGLVMHVGGCHMWVSYVGGCRMWVGDVWGWVKYVGLAIEFRLQRSFIRS